MDTNERYVDYVCADNDGDGREVASRVQASQKVIKLLDYLFIWFL